MPGDPNPGAKRKRHRGTNPYSGAPPLLPGADKLPLVSRETLEADIESLTRVQSARPMKPPARRVKL